MPLTDRPRAPAPPPLPPPPLLPAAPPTRSWWPSRPGRAPTPTTFPICCPTRSACQVASPATTGTPPPPTSPAESADWCAPTCLSRAWHARVPRRRQGAWPFNKVHLCHAPATCPRHETPATPKILLHFSIQMPSALCTPGVFIQRSEFSSTGFVLFQKNGRC